MVRFSVIVPVYNVERSLTRCIDSILSQTFSDFELLLINDGSMDNSGNICDNYHKRDKRVRVFHRDNRGVSSARNIGINNANGEYIAFVDGDDYVESDYLDSFNSCCDDADVSIGGYYLEDELNGIIKKICFERFNSISSLTDIKESFADGCYNYVWGRVIKRELILNHNCYFNESLQLGEDTVFLAKILNYTKTVIFLQSPKYHYVKYRHRTLTSQGGLKDIFSNIEYSNSLLYDELSDLFGSNTDYYMARRIGKGLLAEVLSQNPIEKSILKFLFQQYWFRKTLKYADEIYCDESAKFRALLKTKSYLLVYTYLKYFR